jgi:hypothetical protein
MEGYNDSVTKSEPRRWKLDNLGRLAAGSRV